MAKKPHLTEKGAQTRELPSDNMIALHWWQKIEAYDLVPSDAGVLDRVGLRTTPTTLRSRKRSSNSPAPSSVGDRGAETSSALAHLMPRETNPGSAGGSVESSYRMSPQAGGWRHSPLSAGNALQVAPRVGPTQMELPAQSTGRTTADCSRHRTADCPFSAGEYRVRQWQNSRRACQTGP